MYILKDTDIEFVVNDYLHAHSEEVRRNVIEVVKQDREKFGYPGNGDKLRARLESVAGPAVNYAVLSQKLFFKREIEEFRDVGFLFYEWGFGNTNYCHNGHSQMNGKIFCLDEPDHYYVRKPKKTLVKRERSSRMPKGSPYDAKEICNCVMMVFDVEEYTITDVEPEIAKKKKTELPKKEPCQSLSSNISSYNKVSLEDDSSSNSNSLIIGIVVFIIIGILIAFFY